MSGIPSALLEANVPVWADRPPLDLPVLRGEQVADACVVGLGGSGLSAVAELLDLGLRVIGIDAGVVAGRAAGRNGGLLLAGGAEFHHDAVARWGRERACRIYQQTVDEIARMAADPATHARPTGSLRIATTPEEVADCEAQLAAMQADGFEGQWYQGPEGVGILVEGDHACHPYARCRALADRALARGAQLHQYSPALVLGQGRVVTPQGSVTTPRILVAVDGNLELLLPELRGRVRTTRLQMLATAPTSAVRCPRPVSSRYGFEYWQQLPDGRIAMGGLRDRFPATEWTSEPTPTADLQELLERTLRDTLGVEVPVTHRWGASVGYTPDYLPVAEELAPGLWVCGGYSGTGNVVGAICGRGIARWSATGDRSVLGGFAPPDSGPGV